MGRVLPAFWRALIERADNIGFSISGFRKRILSLSACTLAIGTGMAVVPQGYLNFAALNAQELSARDPNAQLLLKADELVYDNNAQVVTAVGNVQLEYDGFNVVAERVSYNRRTRRVVATGNVEIVEPDGNRIFADKIDLTDDFADGFVNALRVETTDNTRFAAESAERVPGKTVFNNGVYTACDACPQTQGKPPFWQIKAERVVVDNVTKDVTYRNAKFELFGLPIAYLPYFSHADPSVKRKSGFLIPQAGYKEDLGFWYRQRYFLVTGDSHDLTLGLTGFSRQGVLADLRWRHQLENGFYTLRTAGIRQEEPTAFEFEPDRSQTRRGMFATEGRFDINSRWSYGWNILVQGDRNFSRTYDLAGYSDQNINNNIYLRGLNDRSYFDLSAYQYLIQPNTITEFSDAFQDEDQQADVLPSLDYNYVTTGSSTGGEIGFDVNITKLDRNELSQIVPAALSPDIRTHGIDGDSTRVSGGLRWKKTWNTPAGLLITPTLSVRGDVTNVDNENDTAVTVQEGSTFRYMPTAALQASYPLLARTQTSSHVFEPIAQLLVRPSLSFNGVLPNEDSQSLVFDTTTLFQHDKFSGYDRIEGGSRLNAGLRYSGVFESGLTLSALVGQSFHLAGRNPYGREDDLVNTGEESGLESDRSDYVAGLGVGLRNNLIVNLQGRFDEDNFAIRRGETSLTYTGSWLSLTGNYTFIDAQPDYAFPTDRQQIGFSGSAQLADNWTLFGGAQYDIEQGVLISDSLGLRYNACSCFDLSLTFNESRNLDGDVSRSIGFRIGLRTLGEFESAVDASAFVDDSNSTSF